MFRFIRKIIKWILILVVLSAVVIVVMGGSSSTTEVKTSTVEKVKVEAPVVSAELKNKFLNWAVEATAVTEIYYPEDAIEGSIWVKLTKDKYTSKENVKTIASELARYYKLQTGYTGLTIVTVFDLSNDVYAKGRN